MVANKIASSLYSSHTVREELRNAHLRLTVCLLRDVVQAEQPREPDWANLLSWASVLAQSEDSEHVNAALVAAISALLTAESCQLTAHAAAVFVLESCSNSRTAALARANLLPATGAAGQSVASLLHQYHRQLQHFVFDDLASTTIPVTGFQERLWNALTLPADTALSAPTSAGKSYILTRWLADRVATAPSGTVLAYVVPSRALISQVSRTLAKRLMEYPVRPRVVTMPTLYSTDPARSSVLVMTQERMERVLGSAADLKIGALIVDEAHKLGEGSRGVILQRVIDECISRLPACHVVLAAPHASNVEVVLPRPARNDQNGPPSTVTDSKPTVLQNLFWVTPVPRRNARWKLTLVHQEVVGEVGEIDMPGNVSGKHKELACLAFHLSHREGGNIVFTNGAAEAERIALLLHSLEELADLANAVCQEVLDLAKHVREAIHPAYPLATTITRGIGIHYGNMPEIARREQERLFDEGKLKTIVCTSTLLEGVNLPCRNLFVWGPRQGNDHPMTAHAFWNLVGRAGRWGREFAGNIFCIDVHDKKQWPMGPPARRFAQPICHSGAALLGDLPAFRQYAESATFLVDDKTDRYFEQVLGELVAARLSGRGIGTIGWARWCSEAQRAEIDNILDGIAARVTAPMDLLRRHRGINPVLISEFMEHLGGLAPTEADEMMPMSLNMRDAAAILSQNLAATYEHLGAPFRSEKLRNLVSRLTVDWMRGRPLGQMIRERLEYMKRFPKLDAPKEIRGVFDLIEKNARFLIPKYLGCYADCVSVWYKKIGRLDLAAEITDMQDMLESGVSDRTMLALIGLGLTRTSAVEIAGLIPSGEMSVPKVIAWLRGRDLAPYGISPVITREVQRSLETTDLL